MRALRVDTQKGILIYGKGIAGNQYVITNLADEFQVLVADTLPNLVNAATGHQADLMLFELRKGRYRGRQQYGDRDSANHLGATALRGRVGKPDVDRRTGRRLSDVDQRLAREFQQR